jgi:hypothetical protein
MPPENPAQAENTELPTQETVHSNKPDNKVEKSPEEKELARLAFERRQKEKQWKRKQVQLDNISDEDALKEVEQAAKEAGFDASDDKSKANTSFIAKSIARVAQANSDKHRNQLKQEATQTLTTSMTAIGLDPMSHQGRSFGNYQYLSAYGGRYCSTDSSGNAVLAGASTTALTTWVDTCYALDHNGSTASCSTTPFIGSAVAGTSVVSGTKQIHTETDAYWIPSDDTLTAAYIGLKCDLIIIGSTTTTLQKLKPTVTSNKIVEVLDVDIANQLALVYAIL